MKALIEFCDYQGAEWVKSLQIFGIRVIYGHSHIYLNLGICLGCKIQVSDLASFVDVIDVHVYFWCHSLVLIFYHIA